jgi:hypothetical protein
MTAPRRRSPARLRLAAVVTLALLTCGAASAQIEPLLLGGSHRLEAGQTHSGSLTAVASELAVAADARVDGSLTFVGGRLELDGAVAGTVHGYGATIVLAETARIGGGLELTASELVRADGAVVGGEIRREESWPIGVGAPRGLERFVGPGRTVPWSLPVGPWGADWFVFSVLLQGALLALAAFVIARLAPHRLNRIAAVAVDHPLPSGLSGLLWGVVSAVVAVFFAITIIGIPLALLVGLVVWAATVLGLIALSDRLGDRLWPEGEDRGGRAALGGFLLGLLWAALAVTPGLAAPIRTVVGLVALGAVVRSRVGEPPAPSAVGTGGGDGGAGAAA